MVAVVGAPAQSQFAQVSGADHKTAGGVGNVHQHLGPLPGLGVFIGDGMIGFLVADVAEVQAHCLVIGNLPTGYPQGVHQGQGVAVGVIGGAKAGHGDAGDVGPGKMHQVHGLACGQQRQGGIQSAGNTHGYLSAGDAQAAGQSRGLQVKNLGATGLPGSLVRGNEGMLGHMQPGLHMVGQPQGGTGYCADGLQGAIVRPRVGKGTLHPPVPANAV